MQLVIGMTRLKIFLWMLFQRITVQTYRNKIQARGFGWNLFCRSVRRIAAAKDVVAPYTASVSKARGVVCR